MLCWQKLPRRPRSRPCSWTLRLRPRQVEAWALLTTSRWTPQLRSCRRKGLEDNDVKAYRLKAMRAVKAYAKLVSIHGLSEEQVHGVLLDSTPGKAAATHASL